MLNEVKHLYQHDRDPHLHCIRSAVQVSVTKTVPSGWHERETTNQIRPIALCVFLNNNRILVNEGYNPIKQQTFYRSLGGRIEFGEKAEDTVRRELKEELNVEVGEVRYLGTLENIFTFNGTPGHEIVLIFDGALEMSGLYEQAVIVGEEAHGAVIRAVWKSLDEFGEGKSILYPDGLLNLLLDSLKEFMRERQVLLPRQFEQIMCAAPQLSKLLSACAKLRMLAHQASPSAK